MYYSNMILLILTTILIYTYKSSLAVIPIFLIGFSIIARAMKNKKVSNILCWVIVIPMLIVPFLSPLYIPSFDRSCAFDFEIGAFNSKFTQYEGNNKNKALVKSLIINVVSSNEKPENKNRKVAIIFNGEEQNDLEGINSKLTSNKYKISVERGDDEYVKKVIIEENIDSTNITNDVKEKVIKEK